MEEEKGPREDERSTPPFHMVESQSMEDQRNKYELTLGKGELSQRKDVNLFTQTKNISKDSKLPQKSLSGSFDFDGGEDEFQDEVSE